MHNNIRLFPHRIRTRMHIHNIISLIRAHAPILQTAQGLARCAQQSAQFNYIISNCLFVRSCNVKAHNIIFLLVKHISSQNFLSVKHISLQDYVSVELLSHIIIISTCYILLSYINYPAYHSAPNTEDMWLSYQQIPHSLSPPHIE